MKGRELSHPLSCIYVSHVYFIWWLCLQCALVYMCAAMHKTKMHVYRPYPTNYPLRERIKTSSFMYLCVSYLLYMMVVSAVRTGLYVWIYINWSACMNACLECVCIDFLINRIYSRRFGSMFHYYNKKGWNMVFWEEIFHHQNIIGGMWTCAVCVHLLWRCMHVSGVFVCMYLLWHFSICRGAQAYRGY